MGFNLPCFLPMRTRPMCSSALVLVQHCWNTWARASQTSTLSYIGRLQIGIKLWPMRLWDKDFGSPPGTLLYILSFVSFFPKLIGSFPVSKVINPVVMRLKLPRSMRFHHTCNMTQMKQMKERKLVPFSSSSTHFYRSLVS